MKQTRQVQATGIARQVQATGIATTATKYYHWDSHKCLEVNETTSW